ncbi:formimidoylglutamase [Bacillus tianshenii]|uniref:formimidoylglutamase n=1 Tax=Sutcliffiella tianshenii TaxID=1463404 RepID=UPI001CD25A84|nr:formimidoylglutamase [Bacillus tianshenii]MCA1319191.1 formimidoylglutamase [Bacillus tianshenii]
MQKAGGPPFVDRHYPKAAELLLPWDGKEEVEGLAVIGVPLSKPSISHSGASFTPGVFRRLLQSYSTYAVEDQTELLSSSKVVDMGDIVMHATSVEESYRRIEEAVSAFGDEHPSCLPVFIGGDHSITYSTLKGLTGKKGNVGVIQFDAHHDLRNTEDGGPTNGTPFRRLLEADLLKGENLVQIGIRNYSNSAFYHQYAREQGVTIFSMADVKKQGIAQVIASAIEYLEAKVDHIYVSVDIDVLDQAFAPGCPAIGPGGMTSEQLLEAIHLLGKHKKVCALDMVEIDPTIDFRDMTTRVAVFCLLEFMRGRASK